MQIEGLDDSVRLLSVRRDGNEVLRDRTYPVTSRDSRQVK